MSEYDTLRTYMGAAVSVDVFYAIHDCALGLSHVTSLSGVKHMGAALPFLCISVRDGFMSENVHAMY